MSACSRPLVVLGVGVMALLAAVTAAARVAEDGGSATYTGDGPTYLFDVTNSGSTTWKYFYFVGPPGSGFTGGQLTGGATGPCVPGQPDGTPNEIECGPLSSGGGPGTLVLFTGTTSAPVACASAFQLFVNSTGTPP
jgi:hypothetical protein